MPRPEKVQAVADIKERIEGAQAVFLAEYAGLSVKNQQALRRSLRENGAEFKVVKMSMARLAAAELDIDTLDELLLGPTGLAFADDDPAGTAKVLKDFAKDHDTFTVKGGLLGLEFLPPEKIAELAELEPREVLLAKNTANALSQLLEKKEAEAGEPSAAEQPKDSEDSVEAESSEPKADRAEEAEPADEASSTTEDDSDTTAEASDDADDESDDDSADAEVAVADAAVDAVEEEEKTSADADDEE